jgi:putative selenate reductase
VGRFRETFADRYPISFSAGIDRHNFTDAVSLGLVPVTVCSDLLRTGGYGRMRHYFADLAKRMKALGARDVSELVLRGQGEAEGALAALADVEPKAREACLAALGAGGDLRAAAGPELFARWVSEAKLRNTRRYLDKALAEPRYASAANAKAPRKVGTKLWLFECLTCDKCVPVCPNDANFAYDLPKIEIPVVKLVRQGGGYAREEGTPLSIAKKHQIANYADACNECGNCDVFCPEDGGPYNLKPRFFGSEETFRRFATHDGFFLARAAEADTVLGRFEGKDYRLELAGGRARFAGAGFDVEFAADSPEATLEGAADEGAVIDLTYFRIMDWLRRGVLDAAELSWINA